MDMLIRKMRSMYAYINKAAFNRYEQKKASHSQGINILFSRKPMWEENLRRSFAATPHRIQFEALTEELLPRFDLIVPLSIDDLNYLDRVRPLITNNRIPIPASSSIRLCDDKILFNRTMINAGFGAYIPPVREAAEDILLSYPYILKRNVDEWGENSHIISDAAVEQRFSSQRSDQAYFSQQLVLGKQEYATHIIFRDGVIVHALSVEYGFHTEMPIKGRDTVAYTKICRNRYLNLFADILKSINFDGLCCFNYKISGDKPLIFEINPRFGGSLSHFFFSFVRHLY